MSEFAKRFQRALDEAPDSLVEQMPKARDAFLGTSDDDRTIALHLQSDEQLLVKLVRLLQKEGIKAEDARSTLELIFCALYSAIPISPEFVVSWLQLVKKTSNFERTDFRASTESHRPSINGLAIEIFLTIIQAAQHVPLNRETLNSDFFLARPGVIMEVHDHFMDMAQDLSSTSAVLLMAWGMYLNNLLQTTASSGLQEEAYQELLDHVLGDQSQEPHRFLIESAIRCNIYGELRQLNENVPRRHKDQYKIVLLRFFLDAQTYVQLTDATPVLLEDLVTSRALASLCWQEPAVDKLLAHARQAFPYEYRPFIRFMRTLARSAPQALSLMESLPTFTQMLPVGFQDYETLSSESGQSLIEIHTNLKLFATNDVDASIILDSGSRGLMVTTDKGSLVLWQHSYSAIQYIYHVLQSTAESLTIKSHPEEIEDTVCLFTRLLQSCDNVAEFLRAFQSDAARSLPSTIFRIYEQSLQTHGSVKLVIESISFFDVLLSVDPATAWPFVSRMTFVDRTGLGTALSDFTSSVEGGGLACDFVSTIGHLVATAISDTISSALSLGDYFAKLRKQFLSSGINFLLNCFHTYPSWPVNDTVQRYSLGALLHGIFLSVLKHSQESQLASCPRTEHILSILSPTAEMILQQLAGMDELSSPILRSFRSILQSYDADAEADNRSKLILADSMLDLCGLMLTLDSAFTARIRQYCFSCLSQLLPLFLKHHERHRSFSMFLFNLLEHKKDQLAPILAALGETKVEFRQDLIDCLKGSSEKSQSESSIECWRLVACLIQPEQEGVALFLLEQSSEHQEGQILQAIAEHVEQVSISAWTPATTVQVLKIMLAAQHWAPTVHEQLKSRTTFWQKLRSLFTEFHRPPSNQSDEAISVVDAYRLLCASLVSKIIATELTCLEPSARARPEWSITSLLDGLEPDILEIKHYRASLHHNLARNISQKFPGFSLSALRVQDIRSSGYGETFFYNLALATQMLRVNSFLRELRTANFNLSIVDAQGHRAQGLQVLLTSLTFFPITSKEQWLSLSKFTTTLLSHANDIPLLEGMWQETSHTASVLVKSLCHASKYSLTDTFLSMLEPFSQQALQKDLVKDQDFQAKADSLQQILQVLGTQSLSRLQLPQLQRLLVGVFDRIVCAHNLQCVELLRRKHDAPLVSRMNVLVVIGRLLVDLIRIHDMPRNIFSAVLLQSNLTDALVGLFSSLRNPSEESSYSAICAYTILQTVLMLHEVTHAADQLMHGGLHHLLLESEICVQIQNSSTDAQSILHSLWIDGVLPLILCLTNTLGARIKDELQILVQAYSQRVERAIARWTRPQGIETSMTQELILTLLFVGSYDNMLSEPDQDYLSTRQALAGQLEYLLKHPKTTSALSLPGNDETKTFQDLQTALDIIQDGYTIADEL